jgi:putative oxidoreductase
MATFEAASIEPALAATLLRLAVGAFQIPHGLAKLGSSRLLAEESFAGYGMRPASVWVKLVGASQIVLGVLLVLGLFTRPAALLTACLSLAMINVALRRNGWFWQRHGMEYAAFWTIAALVLAMQGPGALALDALLPASMLATPSLAAP